MTTWVDEPVKREYNGQAEAQVKQTQVSEQAGHLAHRIEQLLEVVDILEGRLAPLLRDEKPNERVDEKALPLVHHAEFLRGQAWNIEKVHSRVTFILERLEL